MTSRRGIAVIVCVLALVAGGAVALAAGGGGGGERPRASLRVTERAGAGEVALVPSHNAGVGGWCLVHLRSGKDGKGGDGAECSASERSTVAEEGRFTGRS